MPNHRTISKRCFSSRPNDPPATARATIPVFLWPVDHANRRTFRYRPVVELQRFFYLPYPCFCPIEILSFINRFSISMFDYSILVYLSFLLSATLHYRSSGDTCGHTFYIQSFHGVDVLYMYTEHSALRLRAVTSSKMFASYAISPRNFLASIFATLGERFWVLFCWKKEENISLILSLARDGSSQKSVRHNIYV